MRKVKVVSDFEDCDVGWKIYPKGKQHNIPRSTLTGKTVLREVAQGHTVEVNFDDGDHVATKSYLEAMAKEYDLLLVIYNDYCWNMGPEPTVRICAESQDPEDFDIRFCTDSE